MYSTWTALAIAVLLPSYATAFYPHAKSAYPVAGGFRYPVYRVSTAGTQRANRYNIISGEDPSTKNSLGVAQDGTDFSYMVEFRFGSSDEVYHLLVDSAAANTWVMGDDCHNEACDAHNTFGPDKSSTVQVSQTSFEIQYGTGTVSGVLVNDTANFAAFSIPLTFGMATDLSKDFFSYPMDGIFGLGRASNAGTFNAPTVMDVLAAQKLIPAKVYGLSLWRASDGGTNDGVLNFGAPDTSRYRGDLAYAPALDNPNGFWEVTADDLAVDGKKVGLTGRTAILDSGTSFILLPAADAAKLHELVPDATPSGENFLVPCDTDLVVELRINGESFGISPRDWVGRPSGADDGKCFSYIIGRQTFGERQWLVGDVFFKNVYALFDYDGKRVGLGVSPAATAPAPTSSSGGGGSPSTAATLSTITTTRPESPSPGGSGGPDATDAIPPPAPSIPETTAPALTTATRAAPSAPADPTASDPTRDSRNSTDPLTASSSGTAVPVPLLPGQPSSDMSGSVAEPNSSPGEPTPTSSDLGPEGAASLRHLSPLALGVAVVVALIAR